MNSILHADVRDLKAKYICVSLATHEATGLIISHPTGVMYSTQTGGMCCNHPYVEGFFVPLYQNYELDSDDNLHGVLCGPPSKVWDAETLNKVDRELIRLGLALDHDRISELQEAWVPVVIVDGNDLGWDLSAWSGTSKMTGRKATLIYGNCD